MPAITNCKGKYLRKFRCPFNSHQALNDVSSFQYELICSLLVEETFTVKLTSIV